MKMFIARILTWILWRMHVVAVVNLTIDYHTEAKYKKAYLRGCTFVLRKGGR